MVTIQSVSETTDAWSKRANTKDNERRTPDVVFRPDECDASDV